VSDLTPLAVETPRGFGADLAWSFLLPLVRGNWGILVSLTLAMAIAGWIPLVGFLLTRLVSAYLAALSLATIAHAASGEDDFPNVWIHNVWEDLVLPFVQFAGSWLIVLAPLIVLSLATYSGNVHVPASVPYIVGGAGLLFFGGSLNAARPDIVVRTALAAPPAYLTVCAGVAIAGAIQILPDYYPLESPVAGIPGTILVGLAETALSVYALLVASRIVGLYYRHFKNRLPWTAE
jgi:hypothetical protein